MFAGTSAEPEGRTTQLDTMLDQMIPELVELGDEAGLAIAFLCRAQVGWMNCRYTGAKAECDLALASAEAAGDAQWVLQATMTRGSCALRGSTPVSEIMAIVEEMKVLEGSTYPSLRPFSSGVQSMVLGMLGQFDEARRSSDEAMRMAVEFQGRITPAMYQGRCRLESLAGNYEAGERFIAMGYDDLVRLGNVVNSSTFAGYRGRALVRLVRADEARRWAGVCRERTSSDDVINQHLWRTVDAVLAARDGRSDEADRLIDEAVEWADRSDDLLERAELCLDEAEIHHLGGRDDHARKALDHARELYALKGATVGVAVVARQGAFLGLD